MRKESKSYSIFTMFKRSGYDMLSSVKYKHGKGFYGVIKGKDVFLGYKSRTIYRKIEQDLFNHLRDIK